MSISGKTKLVNLTKLNYALVIMFFIMKFPGQNNLDCKKEIDPDCLPDCFQSAVRVTSKYKMSGISSLLRPSIYKHGTAI